MTVLNSKIKTKKANIAIVGLGYVGLPLLINFTQKGFKTYGLDIDKKKINLLNSKNKKNPLNILSKTKRKKIIISNNFSYIRSCDSIIICVPTPLKKNKKPELKYIQSSIKYMVPYLRKNQILSLESTTFPGTTSQEIINKINNNTDLMIGKNFFVCYSPERINPGKGYINPFRVPKILSGKTSKCKNLGKKLYEIIFKKVVIMESIESAEFTKLIENVYRSVNIALVNELKLIAEKLNLNIHKCIKAAATKPFGYRPFIPGPGFGGHCIPIDPYYLSYVSRLKGYNPKFIEHAGNINRYLPKWICSKIFKYNFNNKKNIKILILGVSYKKGIDDYRESPAVEIAKILIKKDFKVFFHDPYVSEIYGTEKNFFTKFKSIKISPRILKSFDSTIIVTDHDELNYDLIRKNSKVIFDSRNVYKKKFSNVISV